MKRYGFTTALRYISSHTPNTHNSTQPSISHGHSHTPNSFGRRPSYVALPTSNLIHRLSALYKDRFLAKLPPSRRASTYFTRPVFNAAAFFLCAKKQKLKVDKLKLIEVAGTSESEFSNVCTSMMDLCFDIFGIAKEKKDTKEIKGNRGRVTGDIKLLQTLFDQKRSSGNPLFSSLRAFS